MARIGINTGAIQNDGTGDVLKVAGGKINSNFLEVYTYLGAGSTTVLSAPIWGTTISGINTLRNVGIGTTVPTNTLTVAGSGTSTSELYVSGSSTLNGSVNISSDVSFTNNSDLYLKDNGVIYLGNSNDLQIFHNGSTSVIRDGGTGGLLIDSDNEIKLAKNGAGNDTLAVFSPDGSVELFFDNSKKIETIGSGVTVTGTTFSNQLNVSGVSTFNGNVKFNGNGYFDSNDALYFGSSNQFFIYRYEGLPNDRTVIYNSSDDIGITSPLGLYIDDGSNNYASFTNSGTSLYHQTGALTPSQSIRIDTTTQGTDFYYNVSIKDSGGSEKFILNPTTGKVGIGTTNPSNILTVVGGIGATHLSVSGVSTFSDSVGFGTNVVFSENARAIFGVLNQFQIFYDGLNSKVYENSIGGLEVRTSQFTLNNQGGTDSMIVANETDSVDLYYNNSLKIKTTGIGITVYGKTETQELSVSGISTFNSDISVGINTSNGLILTSPNGTRYRLIVADDGTLSTVAV
jgi:hypothetical protein